MTEALRVLLVEDDDDHAAFIRRLLADADWASISLRRVATLESAIADAAKGDMDVLLLDLGLPDSPVSETLQRVLASVTHVPIIVLTAFNDRDAAVRAVRQGAQDYLVKSQLSGELLVRSIHHAVQRKRAEEELRRLNETLEQRVAGRTAQLEQRTRQLRALASELTLSEQRERRRISIELHDYLAQMLVASKLKLAELEDAAQCSGYTSCLEQARVLIDDALAYARTLIAELSPSILYVSGLCPAVRWLAELMQRQHDLRVEVVIDDEISDIPEDTAVLIFQTIRELLFNVVKHAGVREVVVELRREHSDLSVAVTDSGRGFGAPLNAFSALSGKFGLFNIQERIEALGGTFSIESRPGRGARVAFRLRLPSSADNGTEAEAQAAAWPETGPTPRHINVLVVDDHKLVREGLRRMINRFDNVDVVGEAQDGEQAVDMARALHPDAIIMDINMPRMNGLEATRIIKDEMPQVVVIGHSVHDDEEIVDSLREAGITSYLTKGGAAQDVYRALSAVWSGD